MAAGAHRSSGIPATGWMISASGWSSTSTLYTDGVPERCSTSSAVEALPCGSRSMTRTREPCWARLAARLTAVVVLPTPPFWFAIVMIRQRGAGGQAPHAARGLGRPADRGVHLVAGDIRDDDRRSGHVRPPAVCRVLDGHDCRPLTLHLNASRSVTRARARIRARTRVWPAQPANTDAGRAGLRDAFRLRHQRPVRPAQSGCALPVIARPHLCPASSSGEPNDGRRWIDLTLPRPYNPGVAGTYSAQHRTSRLQFFRCRAPLDRQDHSSRPHHAHR